MEAGNKIELTLAQVRDMSKSIGVLLNAKLPIATSYRVLKMAKRLNDELKTAEKVRSRLVDKYGEAQPDGSTTVPAAKLASFRAEYDELIAETTTIEVIPLKLSELEGAGLALIDLINLEFLIDPSQEIQK